MGDPKPGDVVVAIGAASGPAELTEVRMGGICYMADATITTEGGSPVSLTDLRLWANRAQAEGWLGHQPATATALYLPEEEAADAGTS